MSLKNKDFLCAMYWQHKTQLLQIISNSKDCINMKKVFRYAGKSIKGVQLFKMWLEFHFKTGIKFLTNLVDYYYMITCYKSYSCMLLFYFYMLYENHSNK